MAKSMLRPVIVLIRHISLTSSALANGAAASWSVAPSPGILAGTNTAHIAQVCCTRPWQQQDWHEAQHDLAAPTGLHRCITRVAQQRSLLKHTRRSSLLPLAWSPACPGVQEVVLTGQDATIYNADKPQAKLDDMACVHPDGISSCAHICDRIT